MGGNAVSQRSESGRGIMGGKTGKGMLLCMLYSDGPVVAHVSGDWSLTERHVNVSCLVNFSKTLSRLSFRFTCLLLIGKVRAK